MSPTIFEPARLGPLTLKNRIIKAATFEGVMPRGAISDDLINFHAEVARGGAAMTTVAYCAVSPGGRVHRDTLVMNEQALPGLRRLTDTVHAEGALAAAQIGHAGLVANTLSNKTKTLAPSTRLSPPAMGLVKERRSQNSTGLSPTTSAPHALPSTPDSTPSRCTSATTICSARS